MRYATVTVAEKVAAFLLLPFVIWQKLVIAVIRHARKQGWNAIGTFTVHQTRLPYYVSRLQDPFNQAYPLAPHEIETAMTYLDVGARGDVIDAVAMNRGAFPDIIMCEGEAAEADRLRQQGYKVISAFVADRAGTAMFRHVAENPGASSLLVPQGPFLKLYGGPDYFDWHAKYQEIPVETSTLDAELDALGIDKVDLVKLDIQGGELAALKGFSGRDPLCWVVETTMHPTYIDMPYGIDLIKELYDRGYLIIGQQDLHFQEGILIWCDTVFAPNWSHPKGAALIRERPKQWRTLMRMFGREHLISFVEKELGTAKSE